MNFSPEILNHILTFRPTHPNAILLKRDIADWNRKRQYFYKYYFNKSSVKDNIQKRKQQISNGDFFFKCCNEDGLTTEQVVKLKYESKRRKQRLANKLQELNLNMWDISTASSLRYLKAYHKGIEIFNES